MSDTTFILIKLISEPLCPVARGGVILEESSAMERT